MRGTHTSMTRRTKQNAATLGVSLVVLGPRWGPPWSPMRDMLILDLGEVGQTKKNILHRDMKMRVTHTNCIVYDTILTMYIS